MTQVTTILADNAVRDIFGDYMPYEWFDRAMTNSVFRYIALNRHKDDFSQIKSNIPSISELRWYRDYTIDTILNYMNENDLRNKIVVVSDEPYEIKMSDDFWNSVIENGYIELNTASSPVNQYLSHYKPTRVFVNSELRRTLIIVKDINSEWCRNVLSSIPRLMPWLFDNDNIPEDEMKLFKSLNDNDIDTFNSLIISKYNEFDLRSMVIHRDFDGYENSYIESQKQLLQSKLKDRYESLREYQEAISDLLTTIKEFNIEYDSLCNVAVNNSNAFAQFLVNHKNIVHISKNSKYNYVEYAIEETIEYFDADAFEDYYNNPRCGFMASASEQTKAVLKGLFIKNVGKLLIYAEFRLTNLTALQPLSAGSIDNITYENRLPHPHLGEFRCLGGNENQINNYLEHGEWDMAIEQTIAAAKNLNFGDSIVMSRLVSRLNDGASRRCIIADNGKRMTTKEFAKYVESLEQKEAKKEAKKKEKETSEQTN